MQKIGVLGAGTMGAGIAQAFASVGLDVVLRDVSDDLLMSGIEGVTSFQTAAIWGVAFV